MRVELLRQVAQAHAQALLEVCFHDLEADAAAAELLVGVGAVALLGVEHRHGARHLVARQVVVADDEVDATLLGVVHLLHGLDAAVEGYHQLHPRLVGVVDALVRNAVTLAFAVRHVEVYVSVQLLQVAVKQRHGRRSVDIVVAINHDSLLFAYRLVDAVHRLSHALHQEGVVDLVESRTEEFACLLKRRHTPLHEQCGDNSVYAQRCCKFFNSL